MFKYPVGNMRKKFVLLHEIFFFLTKNSATNPLIKLLVAFNSSIFTVTKTGFHFFFFLLISKLIKKKSPSNLIFEGNVNACIMKDI